MLVTVFFIISLILTFILCLGAFSFWKIFLTMLGVFLAVNILYILWAFSTSLLVKDTDKPISRIIPACRIATVSVFGLLCSYMGLKVAVSGAEKLPENSSFLLVCNHRSGFDPVVIMHQLQKFRLSCIAKPSIMALPVIGKCAHGIGCLGIDRENDRNALKTILAAANYLKSGLCSICIFPEGTRSRTGELLPFHAGSFKIAQRGNAPLVIASISGTDSVTKNFPLRCSPVRLNILELLPAEKVKAMSTQELADYSRKLIAADLSGVAK